MPVEAKDKESEGREEASASRRRAAQRLKEKRSDDRLQEKKILLESRRKENEGKEKWKMKLKENRKQEVKEMVERTRVIRAMHDHPQIFHKSGGLDLHSVWNEMLPSRRDDDQLESESSEMSNPISTSLIVRNSEEDEEEEKMRSLGSQDMDDLPFKSPVLRSRISSATQPMPVTSLFLRRTVSVSTPAVCSVGNKPHEGLLSRYIRPRGHTIDVVPNSPSSKSPNQQDKGTTISPTNPSTLIDCLLLVGPKKEDLDACIERVKSEVGGFSAVSGNIDSNLPFRTQTTTSSLSPDTLPFNSNPQMNPSSSMTRSHITTANLLFMAPPDPHLEVDYLSYFCFPKGIESTITCASNSHQRRPSISQPQPAIGESNSSDTVDSTTSSYSCSGYDSSLSFIRFVYLITGHYSQQFGICVIVPVTFTHTVGGYTITIKTRYCLTLLTHFPYLRFFFHILTEFILGGGLFTPSSCIIVKQLSGDPIQSDLRQLENFGSKLFRTATPKPGKVLNLYFTINLVHHEYSMRRFSFPSLEQEVSTNVLLWSLPILLKYIPLDQLLLILGCALTEMHIIFRCSNLEVLSACVLGCLSLLSPISWAGASIVILPPIMHDFIESPTPIFFGVESMPTHFKMTNGLIIVDPIQKLVHMHPTDVVSSHTFCLPHASKLQSALKPVADNILKLSKKVKHKKRNSQTNSPSSVLAAAATTNSKSKGEKGVDEATAATAADGVDSASTDDNDTVSETLGDSGKQSSSQLRGAAATFVSSNVTQRSSFGGISSQRGNTPRVSPRPGSASFLPIRAISELVPLSIPTAQTTFTPTPFDDFTNTSPILNTAIISFVDLMKDHIQRVINTAVQLQEERQMINNHLRNTPKEIHLARTNSDGSIETNSDGLNLNYLPSLPADVLPRFSAGSGAAAFLQMFQNTQSFSVYMEKVRPTPQSPEGKSHPPASNSVDPIEEMITPRRGEGKESKRQEMKRLESERLTADPLILLFNIMISGTCPLRKQEVFQLEEKYLSLYPSDRSFEQFAVGERKKHSEQGTPISRFFITPSVDTLESLPSRHHDQFIENSVLTDLEEDLWCNGRCGGLANTDRCTNICLHVWEEKMLQLRKQTTALEIIKANRTILMTQPSSRKEKYVDHELSLLLTVLSLSVSLSLSLCCSLSLSLLLSASSPPLVVTCHHIS
jgi:hypothetical protein